MRTRSLRPGFFFNEDLVDLPPLTRLFFAGMWCLADREGLLEDRPRKLKLRILPADDFDPEKAVEELLSIGEKSPEDSVLERVTAADGTSLLRITNFQKHQNIHPSEAKSCWNVGPATEPQLGPNLGPTVEQLGNPPLPSIPSSTSIPSRKKTPPTPPRGAGKSASKKEDANKILEHLNETTGRRFRDTTNIEARLKGGASVEDCIAVIDYLWAEWGGKPEMVDFVDVITPFRKTKFRGYLDKARAGPARRAAAADKNEAVFNKFREESRHGS